MIWNLLNKLKFSTLTFSYITLEYKEIRFLQNRKNISQNNHLLTKHFSSLFTLKLLLAVVYIITVVVVGLMIGYNTRLMKLLLVQGFNGCGS